MIETKLSSTSVDISSPFLVSYRFGQVIPFLPIANITRNTPKDNPKYGSNDR
jgi:hypothetical protein